MKEKLKQIYRMTNPYFKYLERPVTKGVILYESFFGQNISCGPYALFRELAANEDRYGRFHHVWVIADIETGKKIIDDLNLNADIELVKYKSVAYNKYLATAEFVINNVTFPQYFRKREGQIYVNTWHGIPLKKMGYDTPDGIIASANTVRNMLQADYLLSPNGHHTDMYNEAYKLKNIYSGMILEEGQARCDRLFETDRKEIIDRLIKSGVHIKEGKKLILYAPTWRGTVWDSPKGSIEDYAALYAYITAHIDTDKYQLLIKPHIAVYKKWANESKNIDYIVPSTLDTNEILSVMDILISDYSSIFYDFIVTGRPVLFYCDDIEEYNKYRGTENLTDKLPGPMTSSKEQLADWINRIDEIYEENKSRYEKIRSWAAPREDGHSCRRILDIVMNQHVREDKTEYVSNEKGGCRQVNHAAEADKKKLLFFLGSLRPYGITYSMLSLLQNMDYEKYDVTLYVYKPNNDSDMGRLLSIPKEVRILVHTVAAIGSVIDNVHFVKGLAGGYQENKKYLSELAAKEYVRMFGQSTFDYVIDFVGYSPLFSMVAANAPSGVKSIWQHNDLLADKNKVVNGRKPNKKRLEIVFGTYPEFDHVVACSRSVMEVNKKQIGGNDSYRYVRNMIDIKRIESCLSEDVCADGTGGPSQESRLVKRLSASDDCVNFVNMGRMSEEKNQLALIKAFGEFVQDYENTRLYIMGDGPLRNELISYIRDNNLSDRVILTGNVDNPFAIMKKCQCFILPSLHEGQPMVILEARTLNMPIIMSNFSTAQDCMIEHGQLICGTDSESIKSALVSYMNKGVPLYEFDSREYNRQVLKEFEKAIR